MAVALPEPRELSDRATGKKVVDHRTSWVRKVATPTADAFVKTYEYATWGARLGNLGRWTAPWRPSRAARETAALTWLGANGFPTAAPLLAIEWRRAGFVERATVVTESHPGTPADRMFAELAAAARPALERAITDFVERLHAAGFRDRNLDLRNLLVQRCGDGWAIAKIDSPRWRLVRAGKRDDALARGDWQRLLPQVRAFD